MFRLLEPPVIDWPWIFASATVAINTLRVDRLGRQICLAAAAKPYSMRAGFVNSPGSAVVLLILELRRKSLGDDHH